MGAELLRVHYKLCNKCSEKKPIEDFAGFKRCNTCREKGNKQWHKLMGSYYKAGVKQRIPLTDEERERIFNAFARSCAFCGNPDEDKLRITRLILPRAGGGDEIFNIIPCCTSCVQSRKGWAHWADWYKSNPDLYSPFRWNRLVSWHNELPPTKK